MVKAPWDRLLSCEAKVKSTSHRIALQFESTEEDEYRYLQSLLCMLILLSFSSRFIKSAFELACTAE